ncbi:MAG: NAD-dependent succinate-semialdehyde dehydrogenase [Rubrivivax sp.]|nr:NAD-dependent succinate-semialdehyde dehydrogenase [Rubrivivax sp.]MDP3614855.1 NAD-dependent succinate-semialdehyde dehydrogenase [Rubrivivax sp.]
MDNKTSPLATLADPALLKTDALINGVWTPGQASTPRFAVTDPATGLELAQVANLGAIDAAAAISAAEKAWPAWRNKTAKERAGILMKWFALLHQHADDLARIMTAEQGKPLAEARGEVVYGASFIEWFAEEARRVYGESIPTTDNNKRYLVIRQPIGVCAAITPWNFPIAMITRKVAPALAAGCPVVIKPAEQTPLSALAVAELAQRAGMPAGVLNVLCADSDNSIEIGNVLCSSDAVRHLSFTGSTEVGRILARQCASTVKKISLELGGNAPFIVFDDADIDSAVEGAMVSKYRNAGQTCVCANRLYVQAGVYDAFVEKLAAKVGQIQVGNGFDAGVNQGPLIDDAAVAKVENHVADALAKGARLVVGGQKSGDRFYAPTVLADVTGEMLCAREETFGPVAPVFKFETEAEVVAMANHTEFGLASYFYSRDIGRIFRVGEALEYGMVGVNTGLISTAEVPFGGVKQSGLGREGARQGMDDYLEVKYLCLGDIQR